MASVLTAILGSSMRGILLSNYLLLFCGFIIFLGLFFVYYEIEFEELCFDKSFLGSFSFYFHYQILKLLNEIASISF